MNKAESFTRILFGLYGKYDGGENVSCLQSPPHVEEEAWFAP